jgi:transcription elongation GreA/GreB family factor
MTAEGHAALEEELRHRLQVERRRLIQQVVDARMEDSDLAENLYQLTKLPGDQRGLLIHTS